MNLETKIIIYKFTPQVFTLTPNHAWDYSWDFCQSYYTHLMNLNFLAV